MSKLNDVVYCTIEHKKYRVLSRLITTHRLNLNLGMKIQISKNEYEFEHKTYSWRTPTDNFSIIIVQISVRGYSCRSFW